MQLAYLPRLAQQSLLISAFSLCPAADLIHGVFVKGLPACILRRKTQAPQTWHLKCRTCCTRHRLHQPHHRLHQQ